MLMTRRTALATLAGLVATSTVSRPSRAAASPDPLAGTVTAYLKGLEAGDWTAAEITAIALERCRSDGAAWRAIDVLDPDSALADARAADARRHEGRSLSLVCGAGGKTLTIDSGERETVAARRQLALHPVEAR